MIPTTRCLSWETPDAHELPSPCETWGRSHPTWPARRIRTPSPRFRMPVQEPARTWAGSIGDLFLKEIWTPVMSTNGMEKNLVLDFATRCPSELSGAFSASSRADSNCWHKSASFVVLPRRLLQKPLNLSYSCMRRKHWWSHKIDAICCYQCIRLTADAILRNTKNVALLLGCVDLLCICLFLRLIGLRIRGFFHLAKPLELNIVFGNLRFEWAAAWSIYYAKAWTVTGMRASVSCWVCRSSSSDNSSSPSSNTT